MAIWFTIFHAYVLYHTVVPTIFIVIWTKDSTLMLADHLVYCRQNNLEIYRGHLYTTCAVREYLHSRAYFRAYKRDVCCLFDICFGFKLVFKCVLNWYFIGNRNLYDMTIFHIKGLTWKRHYFIMGINA